jgi:lactate dehydrogenase-like 2-hydroxyacid dehydrogenase
MKVIFYDVVPKMPLGSSRACSSLDGTFCACHFSTFFFFFGLMPTPLVELLSEADFVTLHVPQLPSTKVCVCATTNQQPLACFDENLIARV